MARDTGLEERHARACRSRTSGKCDCTPTWQANVYDKRSGRRIRKTFHRKAEARAWREDARAALRSGQFRVASKVTVRQAAEQWLADARAGIVTNRSGDQYKPSAIRAYNQALRLRVLDEIGDMRFAEVRRGDLQRLVDKLVAAGLSASTVQCSLLPLRAMYRRAISLDEIGVNPTTGLKLPAVRGRRDKIVAPDVAAAMLDALKPADRALWATALYAGLRRGELLALQWEDVDTTKGRVHVSRSWDVYERRDVGPKSAEGKRTVPMAGRLRTILLEHQVATGRREGLVFGTLPGRPFNPSKAHERAHAAWEAAGLDRITLHDARHTYASLMIAAGVNAKALSAYMGHANISITLDRYGHLMPGNEDEAAGLLDAYLDRARPALQDSVDTVSSLAP